MGLSKKQLYYRILSEEGDICKICNEPIEYREHPKSPPTRMGGTIDHIVPVSLGGSNHRSNLRLTHYKCNQDRGNDCKDLIGVKLKATQFTPEARQHLKIKEK